MLGEVLVEDPFVGAMLIDQVQPLVPFEEDQPILDLPFSVSGGSPGVTIGVAAS